MNRKASVVMGSLLGACVLNLLFVACGAPRTAGAQAQGSSCSSWEVATFYQPNVETVGGGDWKPGLGNGINLPAGWEPITATPFGGTTQSLGALVIVRHCLQ